MGTPKLVYLLIVGLVVCAHVHGSAVADGDADDAVLEGGQAPSQTSAGGSDNANDGTAAAGTAGEAANPPENAGAAETGYDEVAAASSGEEGEEEDAAASSTSEENAEGTLEDDEDVPANSTDMNDSLADYILGLLTPSDNTSAKDAQQGNRASANAAAAAAAAGAGAGGNGTQPQGQGTDAGSAAAAGGGVDGGAGAGAGGSQSPQDGGGSSSEDSAEHAGSSAGQGNPDNELDDDDDEEDDEDDEDEYADFFWNDDEWSSDEAGKAPSSSSSSTSSSSTSTTEAIDCSRNVDLRDFCEFTPGALDVFQGDTSLQGLRRTFMDMDIVEKLKACRRGEWCLENKLDELKSMQEKIFRSPLCKDSMWECIFDVMIQRETCTQDKEFLFVVDALDLICSLSGVDSFELQDAEPTDGESRCIAHVQAAVHVGYADFLANGMTEGPVSEKPLCEGYAFRMTETYLCADDSCKGQYESRKSMEEFRRWSWFLVNLDERMETCPALTNDTCGPLSEPSEDPTDWFGMSTSTPFWMTDSTSRNYETGESDPGSSQGGEAGETHGSVGGLFGDEDESMIMALSVATTMALLFMALGLLFFWRRRRGRNAYYYRTVSDGYDKVAGDEARLLGRSDD